MNLDSASELASVVFSDTYAQARQKFLAAVPRSTAYPCSTKGPSGEALFTDAAYFGKPDARKLLVLNSATHGVEGYCGSAAQLTFLQAGFHEGLAASVGVLLIHALNCYGFSWDRRVTAEGCDLNRNCVDFAKPLPANPEYEELHEYFLATDRSEDGMRRVHEAVEAYRAKHGHHALMAARTRGQYTRPGGLFYGGTGPTEARRTLEQIIADHHVAERDEVVIIDYHTGLGPYGYGELECEQASGISGYERALRIWGPSVTSPAAGTSPWWAIYGTQDELWLRHLGERGTYVALEYGTYTVPPERSVLSADHWLFMHKPEEADTQMGRRIRNATKQHYYPQKPDWKEMVISRAHLVHRQAIEALSPVK
jgi:hypothetical protein